MYIQKNKKISLSSQIFIACCFCLITGCLLHFVYQWSGEKFLVGLVSPINESPWEHLKLVYYPMTVFLVIQQIYNKIKGYFLPNLTWVTTLSILLSMLIITSIFYTYSGILGYNIAVIDIAIFFISVIISFYFTYKMLKKHPHPIKFSTISGIIILIILLLLFIYFTVYPPNIAWFNE